MLQIYKQFHSVSLHRETRLQNETILIKFYKTNVLYLNDGIRVLN
jgi:hypothetical protein